MFPASDLENGRPIAPELLSLVQKIEERSPGLYVLAARQFRYPVQQQQINVRVEQHRKVNLLEKFILRATAEMSPAPSLEEIADLLGLDPIFIENAFEELKDRRNIIYANSQLLLTEEGKHTLASEKVPEDPRYETWYYLQDPVLNEESFIRHPLDEMDEELEELEDLDAYVQQDLTTFPAFTIIATDHQEYLQELGLHVHDPAQGRFVTRLAPAAEPELCWRRIAILVLYDSLEEDENRRVSFQARSEDLLVASVGEWLEEQLQAQNLSLKMLCGLTDEMIAQAEEKSQIEDSTEKQSIEQCLEDIRSQATHQLRLQVEGQLPAPESGTAVQLRDAEIHQAFRGALEKAREQIIIYSPWMNEQVVDNEFISLLAERVKRGVRILIGYGIGRDEKREERPVSFSLLQRLHAIRTAEDTPGIIAEWLGNSHAKEIIIDHKVHFSGSQNWLSYRGDRFPRGETVYQVTIPIEVEKAYNHLARRFIERATLLWARENDEDRRSALCILGYLGREQEALTWIQEKAYYHFVPLWLALAHQAISNGQAERILAPLQALLEPGKLEIDLPDALATEINQALQGVLKRIDRKNPELAATLVNGNPRKRDAEIA